MFSRFPASYLAISISIFFATSLPSQGQIIPDATLGSQAVESPEKISITGGAQRGSFLLHSFKEFSIRTGTAATFTLSPLTETVITRVTGRSSSSIDGAIGTTKPANFIFLNPNGIIFGPSASLNTGRSVLFSTASALQFSSGETFSAVNPQEAPLLTINGQPSALLFGDKPRQIVNRSQSNLSLNLPIGLTEQDRQGLSGDTAIRFVGELFNQKIGLQSFPGFELALVGGPILIESGNLTSFNGKVSIHSAGDNEQVKLTPTSTRFGLDSSETKGKGSITFNKGSINTTGRGGGDIDISGDNITLNDSTIFSGTLAGANGGTNRLSAENSIVFRNSLLVGTTIGRGNSPDIRLKGKDIILQNSVLSGATFGPGKSAEIDLQATGKINIEGAFDLEGRGLPGKYPGGITNNSVVGEIGSITLTAPIVKISNQALITSSAINGLNKSGDITINADTLELLGGIPLKTVSAPTAAVPRFGYQVGIFSDAINSTQGGSIAFNGNRLKIANGAFISANSFVTGRSGNIIVTAKESVELRGQLPGDPNFTSKIQSGAFPGKSIDRVQIINIPDDPATIAAFFRNPTAGIPGISSSEILATPPPIAQGGKISLSTPQLTIDQGEINTTAFKPESSGGNISINADKISLKEGLIGAGTLSGDFGNINLNAKTINLNRSLISTDSPETSNGGNIFIRANILTAKGFSGIAANSKGNRGGNISITAPQGIFLSPQPKFSAIAAASGKGIDFNGTVTLVAPRFEFARPSLSASATPKAPKVASLCARGNSNENSSLTFSNRGGLPETASPLGAEAGWQDSRSGNRSGEKTVEAARDPDAQGWRKLPDGTIQLLSSSEISSPNRSPSKTACFTR